MNFVLGRGNLDGSSHQLFANVSVRLSRFAHAGAWAVALLMVCASACAQKSESSRISSECVALNDDQKGSLMAPADTSTVIQVHLDSRLSEENILKIQTAAAEWNHLSRELRQKELFRLDVGVLDEDQYPKIASDCSYDGGDDDRFWIVQENDPDRWGALGFKNENPAGTIRCHQGESLERQVMFVNTRISKADQLQSIVLHEFGHSIGLDHSCKGGAGSAEYIGCDHVTPGHPYRDAVLFPILKLMTNTGGDDRGATRREVPEVKEALRSNDQTRARCLM